MRRVADAESDHENPFRGLVRQERDVGEGPHVALSLPAGRRHEVPVRQQAPPFARVLGDGDRFGDALADCEPFLARRHRLEAPGDHVIRRQTRPQGQGPAQQDGSGDECNRCRARPAAPRACRAGGQVQRDDREPRGPDQQGHAFLHSECRQEEESRAQGPQDRTDGVGQVEETGVPAHEPGGALDDGVGEGKGKPHEEGGNRHLPQHGLQVDPHLDSRSLNPRGGEKARRGRIARGYEPFGAGAGDTQQRGHPEQGLRRDEQRKRVAHPAVQEPAGHGAQPDSDENHREEQRVHRAKAPDGVGDMAEPDDLHAHGGKPGQQQCEPAQTDDGRAGFQLRPFDLCLLPVNPLGGRRVSGAFPGTGRCQVESPRGRNEIAGRGDDLGAAQPRPGYEEEVRQESPRSRSRGVDPVERPDPPSDRGHVALNEVSNQQGQRPPHHQGYGGQREKGDAVARQVGPRREEIPAVGTGDVGGNRGRKPSQAGKDQGDQQTHPADCQLAVSESPEERRRSEGISSVRPDTRKVAADPEPAHEHGDHERGGVDGIAEYVPELADPR